MQPTNSSATPPAATGQSAGRQRDLFAFLFLTVFLAPLLAVAVVGGFGFLIWIIQLIAGPPGPPGS